MEGQLSSVFLNVLLWFVLLELLALAVAPLLAAMLPNLPDRGYGLSKAFGLLLLGFICWLLASLHLCGFTPAVVWFVFLLMLLIGYAMVVRRAGGLRAFITGIRSHAGMVELLFFSLAAFFLSCRFLTPEIFWGEKPMDFTFLNYFIRLENLPPQDPWAAGQTMQYYYFGTFIIAALHKLGGINSAIGYNLAIATLPALLVSALYSIFLWLRPRRSFAVFSALGLTLMANFEVLRLALFSSRQLNFDLFWASTRGFTSPSFAEYPIWAFLFADLHAHVIAIPFAVLLVGLGSRLCERDEGEFSWHKYLHALFFGISWGCLFFMNSWDFLTYGMFAGVLCLVNLIRRRGHGDWYGNAFVPWFWLIFAVAIGGAAAVLPFMSSSGSGIKLHYGWVSREEFNRFSMVFSHLGPWLILIMAGVLLLAQKRIHQLGIGRLRLMVLAVISAPIPLLFALASPEALTRQFPWSVAVCSALLIALAVFGFLGKPVQRSEAAEAVDETAARNFFAGTALICSALLLSLAEFGFLFDRMNTIFKVYNPIWILCGIAAFFVLPELWGALWTRREGQSTYLHRTISLFVPLVLAAALSGGVIDVWIMVRDHKIEGPRPTLNGSTYLWQANSNEAGMIRWINQNVKGLPVTLEAWGDSYREFTRIAMHTGLPTVLGWDHHVKQRGTPEHEVEKRKADVRRIYTTQDEQVLKQLLAKYSVKLLVVGHIETQKYPPLSLRKFDAHPELFPVLYRQGDSTLYGVSLEP